MMQVRNMAGKGKLPVAHAFSHFQAQCDYTRCPHSYLALLGKSAEVSHVVLRLSEGCMLCTFPHPEDHSYSRHMPIYSQHKTKNLSLIDIPRKNRMYDFCLLNDLTLSTFIPSHRISTRLTSKSARGSGSFLLAQEAVAKPVLLQRAF